MTETVNPSASGFGARLALCVSLASCAFFAGSTLLAAPAAAGPAPKVQICHFPPGNPANWHTIDISENAVSKHIEKHGDLLGPCNAICAFLCDDGNACTIDDAGDCEDLGCPATPEPVDCNDSNACTADSCDPETGCDNTALTGESCVVGEPGTCEESTGVCDSVGACDPERTPGCCLETSECEAWDTNLCNNEECVDTECETTSTVECETDACNISVCIPATGACTEDEPIVCPEPECYVNGCHPVDGCFSDLIEGCCIGHGECDDGNNCTEDTCFGVDGCFDVACASGDHCNVLVDCDPTTCAPITQPVICDDGSECTSDTCDVSREGCIETPVDCDDGDVCTAESCDPLLGCAHNPVICTDDGDPCTEETCQDGVGCVPAPVTCDEGELCNPETGACESTEAPCFPVPAGLLSWWTFDIDGADIQSGFNGALAGNAAIDAAGKVDGAVSLDGAGDYVIVSDVSDALAPQSITVDAWVNPVSVDLSQSVVSKYDSSTPPSPGRVSWGLQAARDPATNTGSFSHITFFVCETFVICYGATTANPVLQAGVWTSIAATFEIVGSSNDVKLYVDGVEEATTVNAGSVPVGAIDGDGDPVQVGAFTPISGNAANFWNGLIDEVEIFDRALDASEIQSIYEAGAAGKCKECVDDTDCAQDPANLCVRNRCDPLTNQCVPTDLVHCDVGFTCAPSTGTCEQDCFSMIPAFGTGGTIDECITECNEKAECPNPATSCDLKDDPGFAEVVQRCLDGVDPNACVQVDDYAEFTAGCQNICPRPLPDVSCPCWDGDPQFGLAPSLEAYWSANVSCDLADRCEDINSASLEASTALCASTNATPLETGVFDASGNLTCRVRLASNQTIQRGLTPDQHTVCLAEHRAFTREKHVPNGCGLPSP